MKVEEHFPHGCFSTYVDVYLIFVTHEMLNLVLNLPHQVMPHLASGNFMIDTSWCTTSSLVCFFLYQIVVTPMDAWVIHNVAQQTFISFVPLMFSHMLKIGTDFNFGDLPYASLITTLLQRLGLNFPHRYSEETTAQRPRAQHILCHLRW